MVALSAATFLFVFDSLVVNLALPSIQRDLGIATADLQWAVTAYTLPFGGLLLLGGRLGDQHGRRRVFVAGLALFAGGLLVAGLAPRPAVLFAGRALQGVGAALSAPTALALINSTFPPGPQRHRAFGCASVAGGLGLVVGAISGGVLTGTAGWRWVFLVGLPAAVAAALLVPGAVPETRADDPARELDLPGALTGTAGLVVLVFAISRVERAGVDSATLVAGLAGPALLAGFGWHEARCRRPLLPLRLFRVRSLTTASLGAFSYSGAYLAVIFLTSIELQQVLGLGPMAAGLGLVPLALTSSTASLVAARVMAAVGWRPLAAAGLGVGALSCLFLALAGSRHGYPAGVLPGMLGFGVGAGLTWVPLGTAAGLDVPDGHRGIGYGVYETHQHVGGSIVLAMIAAVLAGSAAGTAAAADPGGLAADPDRLAVGFLLTALLTAAGAAAVWVLARRPGARAGHG
jgi:MFS family permease